MAVFDKNETYNKIAEIIVEKLGVDKDIIKPASTFEDLGADSLDMVEIIMKLEEAFGIEIDDEKAEKLHNVGQVVEYINSVRTK